MSNTRCVLALVLPFAFGGCGLYVPEMNIFSDDSHAVGDPSPQGALQQAIVEHIKCEIRQGVYYALTLPNVQWLGSWGTKVSLKITADEMGALTPNVSLITPPHFTLGLGLSGAAHATRTETIEFTLANEELVAEAKDALKIEGNLSCDKLQNGILIQSDLKIAQFFYDKATIAALLGAEVAGGKLKAPANPFSTLQDQITFVASYGGSVSPTWTFARVAVNPSLSPLFNATRTKTNDVIISAAKIAVPASKTSPPQLSFEAQQLHQAAVIGSSTASSIQSLTH